MSRGNLTDLFRGGRDEDPAEFWRATAAKRGGEIGYFTFATLLGGSARGSDGLPGLLYAVDDALWFEDFERDNWLSKIVAGRTKYEKTELRFGRADVRYARLVSRGGAARCIGGGVPPDRLAPASFLTRAFSTPAVQVAMTDGSSLFFDIMKRSQFLDLFCGKAPPASNSLPR